MKYNQPFDQPSSPNAPYIDGNPSAGIQGSIVPAAAIEYPQRELVNMIEACGLTPTNTVLYQLASAIQSGKVYFGIDAGTTNNLQVTLAPVPVYKNGLLVNVLVTNSNTGPSVLNCNAIGPKPIRRKGNVPILANDMQAGSIAALIFNENWDAFQLIGVEGAGGRGELTGTKYLYVNWNIGNDANDGIAPDAAHALKTIQRAVDIAFFYAPSQYPVIVIVADSTSYLPFYTPLYQGPQVIVIGNEANPQNVLVSGVDTHCCVVNGINNMHVRGLTVATTNPGGLPWGGFIATNSAFMFTQNTRSNNVAGPIWEAFSAATIDIGGTHTVNGDAQEWFWAMINGHVGVDDGVQINLAKNVSVSIATAYAFQAGSYSESIGPTFNLGGFTVTGKRYNAAMNGTINTSGKGANRFPGSIAGDLQTGGQYV